MLHCCCSCRHPFGMRNDGSGVGGLLLTHHFMCVHRLLRTVHLRKSIIYCDIHSLHGFAHWRGLSCLWLVLRSHTRKTRCMRMANQICFSLHFSLLIMVENRTLIDVHAVESRQLDMYVQRIKALLK